jgi:hypothetical protein
MNSKVLQEIFEPLFPINGCECKNILNNINKNYKEVVEYTNECIYVGHCEIIDFETGLKAKSRPKIGKSRYLTALNRGRSQGGCDWIFDYIYFVSEEENYSKLETEIHNELKEFNLNKQYHKELYNLSINNAIDKVKSIVESAF